MTLVFNSVLVKEINESTKYNFTKSYSSALSYTKTFFTYSSVTTGYKRIISLKLIEANFLIDGLGSWQSFA